ncbi:GNS1/SUR4 membrane protein [Ascosphaera apis ARSEF 7405]|uniref:Elongation of fatty acids protein n=1 Tax=Ascosphaera apis ARSEF 7405 TaxID=392613 RepID=A0A168BQH6_9EURO|nr:GNS1/SUR4 membrane protein [Ascosphaera apis ARSEF 7405]
MSKMDSVLMLPLNIIIPSSLRPTVDRPFGAHLWPTFNNAFEWVTGYKANDFRYIPGKTAMSGLKPTLMALAAYYAVILIGREIMKTREAFKLKKLFIAHNLILSTMSAILLALFIEQLLPTIYTHGLRYAFLDRRGGWTDNLVPLYYVTYMTKYIELADTLFLVLKKKPLTFLHTYHHGATAFLVWTQMLGQTPVSWVVITLNLGVHVVMYWYYTQCGRGIRVWWKKYITVFQIAQFVLDLGFVYYASYLFCTNGYPGYDQKGIKECLAVLAGVVILSSYLFLFIAFYFSTYKAYNTHRYRVRHGKLNINITNANGEPVPLSPMTPNTTAAVMSALTNGNGSTTTGIDNLAGSGIRDRRSSLRSIASNHYGEFEHSWHHHMDFPTA